MSVEQRAGEVRPIYRKGDRVLVKSLTGFCVLVIQEHESRENGELWFYGVSCLLDDVLPVGEHRRPPRRGRGLEMV